MFPPRRDIADPTAIRPRRTIDINIGGEIIEMEWEKPGNPTKQDVQDWIKMKRAIRPSPTMEQPAPTTVPVKPAKGLYERATDFGQGILDPIRGMAEGIGEAGREGAKDIMAGNLPSAAGRILKPVTDMFTAPNMLMQPPPERGQAASQALEMAGVPAPQIGQAWQEGNYDRLLGQGVGTIASMYGGAKVGRALQGGNPLSFKNTFEGITEGMGDNMGPVPRPVPVPQAAPTPAPVPPPNPYAVPPARPPVVAQAPRPPLTPAQPTVIPGGIRQPGLGFEPKPVPRLPFEEPVSDPMLYGAEPPPPPRPPVGNLPFDEQPPLPFGEKQPVQPPLVEMPPPRPEPRPPVNTVAAAAKSSVLPEMRDAGVKAERIVQESSKRRAIQDLGTSVTTILEKAGKAGPALARMLTKTRLDAEGLAGKWTVAAKEATAGLTPEQVEQYVAARDSGQIPTDPAVIRALDKRAILDQEVVATMKGSGAGFRTKEGKIEFRERANYWPHIYPPEFFKNKKTAMESLIKSGMSPEEATTAIENASQFGERIISPLHERQANAPGYRTDLDADYLHLDDMAKRATEAKEFGPLDIADPASPISQLVKGTNDQGRVSELLSKQLGRDVPSSTAKDWGMVSKGVMKIQTAIHLSQFAISNMSQLATVPLRSNGTAYVKALAKAFTKKGKSEAEHTGALQTAHQEILREIGDQHGLSKYFGVRKSETFNRTVASLAGKGTAESLFTTLKKNPSDKRARARLDNLLLEDVDTVLKQGALTPEQLQRAGGRMSEITQGRAQVMDLPPLWSGHPMADLIFLYKKYAFRQGKVIKDAILENPARNLPLMLALYTAVGEGVGDIKAGIAGGVSGAITGEGPLQGAGQAIANRGVGLEEVTGPVVDRMIADLSQAWAFGLLGNVIDASTRGPGAVAELFTGPVLGDIADVLSGGAQLLQGNPNPLVKKGAQSVPFIGTGLSQAVSAKTKRKGRSTLPSPPRPSSSLPRVPRP